MRTEKQIRRKIRDLKKIRTNTESKLYKLKVENKMHSYSLHYSYYLRVLHEMNSLKWVLK